MSLKEDSDKVRLKSDLVKTRKTIAEKFTELHNERIKNRERGDGRDDELEDANMHADVPDDAADAGDTAAIDAEYNVNDNNHRDFDSGIDDGNTFREKRIRRQRPQQSSTYTRRGRPGVAVKSSIPPWLKLKLNNARSPNDLCNRLRQMMFSRKSGDTNHQHHEREVDYILQELCKRNIIL